MARNSEIADLGASFPAGHVIQTVFDHDDTITNFGHDTSYVDIGGSDIAITPTSTSSKILYVMNVGIKMLIIVMKKLFIYQ